MADPNFEDKQPLEEQGAKPEAETDAQSAKEDGLGSVNFPSRAQLMSSVQGWRSAGEQRDVQVYLNCHPNIVLIHNIHCSPNETTTDPDCSPQGLGSGVLLRPEDCGKAEGIIITNSHVVTGHSKLELTFPNGKAQEAKLIADLPALDISFLQIKDIPKDAAGVALGDSSKLQIMQNVVAIGSPLGLSGTGTAGRVSAIRNGYHPDKLFIRGLIQTDAAINPGNSGGALLDRDGRLIGINTFIATQGGGSDGLGFAIPINEIISQLKPIISAGKLVYTGLHLVDSAFGPQIYGIEPGSPASEASLRAYRSEKETGGFFGIIAPKKKVYFDTPDVVTEVNGQVVSSASEAESLIEELALSNQPLELKLRSASGAERKTRLKPQLLQATVD